jgi:Fur family peroxide stress response transcriptional regulator
MDNPKQETRDKIEEFKTVSRDYGLNVTHQRLQIFKLLLSMNCHPSAEEVFDAVREEIPTISFDTVYRTLALFERHGIIGRVQYLDTRTRYDTNLDVHYHLVCRQCGTIRDFYWPAQDNLKTPEEADDWGDVESRYLELRGVCRDCQEGS